MVAVGSIADSDSVSIIVGAEKVAATNVLAEFTFVIEFGMFLIYSESILSVKINYN